MRERSDRVPKVSEEPAAQPLARTTAPVECRRLHGKETSAAGAEDLAAAQRSAVTACRAEAAQRSCDASASEEPAYQPVDGINRGRVDSGPAGDAAAFVLDFLTCGRPVQTSVSASRMGAVSVGAGLGE